MRLSRQDRPTLANLLLVEQADVGDGLRRAAWYAVFLANIVIPVAAAYTR